ncbi:Hypothetical protein conserved in the Yarrowia clade [Yarrowia lipolytica]|jgi:hypothetical protein|nr:Hypothetical protein conserved in the Yarrowia clade [Yarrowia lipolytica]
MDTDSAMASNEGIPSLEELKAFETDTQLFRALDFAEMDVHQQLIQLKTAIEKVGGHEETDRVHETGEEEVEVEEPGECSSDPITVEEDNEASDAMDKDTPSEMDTGKEPATETDEAEQRPIETDNSDMIIADEEETNAAQEDPEKSASATLFPDIIKNANFFIIMALLQLSKGRIIDAEQTILRSSSFPFLSQFTAPAARVVNALIKDNFETAYADLKLITEKNKDLTVAWATEQAFMGVQQLAHQMLIGCYKVVRVDAVKILLHMEELTQLQDEWEEFEQDGVSYLKRRDDREHGSGYQLQLQELVAITQQLQHKGLYDEVK